MADRRRKGVHFSRTDILGRRDGRYECTLCGAVLDIPEDKVPLVLIAAASGEPNMRAIIVEGEEIHRCPIHPDAT